MNCPVISLYIIGKIEGIWYEKEKREIYRAKNSLEKVQFYLNVLHEITFYPLVFFIYLILVVPCYSIIVIAMPDIGNCARFDFVIFLLLEPRHGNLNDKK